MADETESDVDPIEFVRAMMGISPEDAEKVRERSSPTRKRAGGGPTDDAVPSGQHGPTADYGSADQESNNEP